MTRQSIFSSEQVTADVAFVTFRFVSETLKMAGDITMRFALVFRTGAADEDGPSLGVAGPDIAQIFWDFMLMLMLPDESPLLGDRGW